MAKKRRSRNRRQTQRRAASSQKSRTPPIVPPTRRPAKLHAKIRIRAAASSSTQQSIQTRATTDLPEIRPVNRVALLGSTSREASKDDLPPGPKSPIKQSSLSTTRTDLGSRLPVFQPIVLPDSEPTWEDTSGAPAQVSHPRSRALITELTLTLLATLVAGVAIRPSFRAHTLPQSTSQAIPQTSEAPDALLNKLEQLLNAQTSDERRPLVTSPETLGESPEESSPLPWAKDISLTPLPISYDQDRGELTVWLNSRLSFSVFVRNELFDWPSLIGLGEQSLDEFFKSRSRHDSELRVMATIAAPDSGPWYLPKEDYERVQLSDLEGMVKGLAYVARDQFPDVTQLSQTDRKRITIRAAYVDSTETDISVPLLTAWVANDWRSRLSDQPSNGIVAHGNAQPSEPNRR